MLIADYVLSSHRLASPNMNNYHAEHFAHGGVKKIARQQAMLVGAVYSFHADIPGE